MPCSHKIDDDAIIAAYHRLVAAIFKRARYDAEDGVLHGDLKTVLDACDFMLSESALAMAEELLGIDPRTIRVLVLVISGPYKDIVSQDSQSPTPPDA